MVVLYIQSDIERSRNCRKTHTCTYGVRMRGKKKFTIANYSETVAKINVISINRWRYMKRVFIRINKEPISKDSRYLDPPFIFFVGRHTAIIIRRKGRKARMTCLLLAACARAQFDLHELPRRTRISRSRGELRVIGESR